MRSSAMTRNTPTPTATDQMMTLFSMAGTWLASTCRSGSATVIMMPMRKLMPTMIQTFLDRVISLPTACPSGIMDISDPSVNRPMPTMSSTPPSRNAIMALLGTGAMVKPSASTISMMGSTDVSDSCMGFLKMEKKPCAFCRFFRKRACSSCTVLLVKLPILSRKKWRICPFSGRYALVSYVDKYSRFFHAAQEENCE